MRHLLPRKTNTISQHAEAFGVGRTAILVVSVR